MMGRRDRDQASLFYDFNLDEVIPENHLLRRLDVFVTTVLADLHEQLQPFYSDIGRPSVDPRADDAHAHRRLLLRHPPRAQAM